MVPSGGFKWSPAATQVTVTLPSDVVPTAVHTVTVRTDTGEVVASAQLTTALPARRRTLLQSTACNSNCAMTFKGQTLKYCYCTTLSTRSNLTVYYSQVEDNTLDIGMTMTDPNQQYMSIGFPARKNTMIGADAVVARTSTTGNGAWTS